MQQLEAGKGECVKGTRRGGDYVLCCVVLCCCVGLYLCCLSNKTMDVRTWRKVSLENVMWFVNIHGRVGAGNYFIG